MNENIEKASIMEDFTETNAIVQLHRFVYDTEKLDENIDYTHSMHLVIYGGDELFGLMMRDFLYAMSTGQADTLELNRDTETGESETRICFRASVDEGYEVQHTSREKKS